jgi:ribonuclease D
LSKQALDYARLDTHFLLSLRQIQLDQLKKQNRLREAMEAFERETHVEPSPKVFDPNDFWRVKKSRDLLPGQQAVLRELFILRDKIARKIDRPPFKVINDPAMVRLAEVQPESSKELLQIKGVSEQLVRHNAHEVLRAIQRGRTAPPPLYQPENNRPDEETLNRYEGLRQWRNSLAAERGVEPDVIVGNDTLMNIARRNPKTLKALTKMEVLGDWQFETYGKTMLNVLRHQVGSNS